MKLKDTFVSMEIDKTTVLVSVGDAGFSGVVQGNGTFGAIVALLREDTTEEALTDAMEAEYDAPRESIVRDVKKAMTELRRIGALDE